MQTRRECAFLVCAREWTQTTFGTVLVKKIEATELVAGGSRAASMLADSEWPQSPAVISATAIQYEWLALEYCSVCQFAEISLFRAPILKKVSGAVRFEAGSSYGDRVFGFAG